MTLRFSPRQNHLPNVSVFVFRVRVAKVSYLYQQNKKHVSFKDNEGFVDLYEEVMKSCRDATEIARYLTYELLGILNEYDYTFPTW